jgi:ligand-binding sensor domain-containing protein/signal transduction histidine kinase/CheY-like chemotaxis protein/AraC-like DNA-binding protein
LKKILYLLFFLFCFHKGRGQEHDFYFKNYQIENGLSSNTITSVTQDKKGFMWFGSRNGLNRFDGLRFKVFQHDPGDGKSLGTNFVKSIHESTDEKLWVGTSNGVYIYDPVQESFSLFGNIPPGEVEAIEEDAEHNLWILSKRILYQFNQKDRKVTRHVLNGEDIVSIAVDKKGTLWAADSKGLLENFNPAKKTFTSYKLRPANRTAPIGPVDKIYPAGDSSILVSSTQQVFLYNYRTGHLKTVFRANSLKPKLSTYTIAVQRDGTYWLGTETGLYVLDLQQGTTTAIKKQYGNPYALSDNIIWAIYADREGGTWIGTYYGGINYYCAPQNRFKKYFPEPGNNGFSGNVVHEICQDNRGNLWVGTEDAGLNEIDLRTGRIKNYLPDSPNGISEKNVHGLLPDGDKLWIGSLSHGLDVMDLRSKKIVKKFRAGPQSGLQDNFIITLYKTRDGTVLAGTQKGLFKFDRKLDRFNQVPFYNVQIQSVLESSDGTLWACSYGGGAFYYDQASKKQVLLNSDGKHQDALISNYVNSLFEDRNKCIWFCTEGGLSRYDPKSKKFKSYTTANGLPNNQTFRILEDKTGNLWISTANGLAVFNPLNNSFNAYHASDGLPTEQFNFNSSFKDTNGRFYFGTVKGMISFNPERLTKNTFIPPVYITGLQVNNKDLDLRHTSTLRQSILYTQEITLPYQLSSINLDVAALSYINPEGNQYRFKMSGLDKNWTTLQQNRRIYYTNMAPGSYTFSIQGANSEGVWNTKETILKITITPPWWKTYWACFLYVVLLLLIILTIMRYYHLAVSEKNKRKLEIVKIGTEREIYNAKINFFTNIAHEIRTPLTLIKMPLDKLLSKDRNSEDSDNLNMINKNTNRLIDLTNQLLDFRKTESASFSLNFIKTDINELLSDVFSDFKLSAQQKNLNYVLELPRLIVLHAFVDPEAMRKILANLISNAIKYSESRVLVKLLPLTSEDEVFYIQVSNDGLLIPSSSKDKIFEPFFRLKETEKEPGTGIGLPIARSLAQLHGGNVELKASSEALNIFLLSIPMFQKEPAETYPLDQDEAYLKQATPEKENLEAERRDKPVILLAEDNKEIIAYIRKELDPSYQVLEAGNGYEAFQLLQNEHIQLVVTDIMMPVMDGIELCRKIREDFDYSHLPIILLTAKSSQSSRMEGLEVGADAYIEKPFSMDHLLAQISNLLTNRNYIKDHFARSPLTHMKGIAHSKGDAKFLEQLSKMIFDNITDMNLDVDKLSSLMNMSRTTLYRKIKGLSDMTPNELINLTRLKKAAELLAQGDLKINEVATLIGYTLHANFSRDFQRQFGLSPTAYLNSLPK